MSVLEFSDVSVVRDRTTILDSVSWQVAEVQDLPREVLDSASRQADDLIGDNKRLGELAVRYQFEALADLQQAVTTWQRATFTGR